MAVPAVTVYPGAASQIRVAGEAVIAIYAGAQTAIITNPATATDQGLLIPENLYVDLINPAALAETATTTVLVPGQTFVVPAGTTENVTVNAASAGHKFTVVVVQQKTPFPPTPPTPAPFPPTRPVTVLKTKNAYLYVEYNDDDDLQAFFKSYNLNISQQYLDWFNNANLPIYTELSDGMLDWVAEGLYGISRPVLPSGQNVTIGPFNTYGFDQETFGSARIEGPVNVFVTTDDIFKRIITWNTYKGDGRTFNVRWLKRRIMRFLLGVNGSAPNIDTTYQVSVSFGLKNQVNINLLQGTRLITGGATFNEFAPDTQPFNATKSGFISYNPLPDAAILKAAIEAGVLQLPFQYTFVVSVV